MTNSRRHDECESRSGESHELFSTVEQVGVIGDVAVDAPHRCKGEDDAPIVRLIDEMRGYVLQGAQAEIWWPIQTPHHLEWEIVIENEVNRRRLHEQLRGIDERLFEIDGLM